MCATVSVYDPNRKLPDTFSTSAIVINADIYSTPQRSKIILFPRFDLLPPNAHMPKMLNRLFSWLESRVYAFPAEAPAMPPASTWGFIRFYARPFLPIIVVGLMFSVAIAIAPDFRRSDTR